MLGVNKMDFVSLFKQDEADRKRGKYLSRLFGIFSEDIVRIWAADEKCHYEDLGRPSIRFEGETYTLDFTFQHKQSRKVYIVEQKCEIEFQNYKFFILNKKEQLSHHIKAKKAFMAFLEAAKKNIISASVGKQEIKIDGTILIWGAATPKGINDIKLEYEIDDILTLEKIIDDLILWRNDNFYKFVKDRIVWSNEMLSGLLAIKYIEREDSEVVELIDCQTPSTTVDTGLDQLIETNQSQAKSAKTLPIIQNGIPAPMKAGKCKAVWDACQEYYNNTGRVPSINEVIALPALKDANINNTKTEFYRWRKFNGLNIE